METYSSAAFLLTLNLSTSLHVSLSLSFSDSHSSSLSVFFKSFTLRLLCGSSGPLGGVLLPSTLPSVLLVVFDRRSPNGFEVVGRVAD